MAGYDKLTPEGKKFYAELEKLKQNEVFIGYQAGHAKHTDEDGNTADMAEIAMFNELGTENSPPRPFLRMTVDENKEKINQFVETQTKRIAQGASAEQCMKQMGAFGVSLVQEKIGNGTFTPLKESTIKAKGSDKPLIDTGQMRQSVHYVIKKGGS